MLFSVFASDSPCSCRVFGVGNWHAAAEIASEVKGLERGGFVLPDGRSLAKKRFGIMNSLATVIVRD